MVARHLSPSRFARGAVASWQLALHVCPNYSVKWTAATCHGNLTLTVAAATYLKR